jgi:hypothetical protein
MADTAVLGGSAGFAVGAPGGLIVAHAESSAAKDEATTARRKTLIGNS